MSEFITTAKHARDLRGQRFGRLTAIGPVGRSSGKGIIWLCRCDCGTLKNFRMADLVHKNGTRSCGCLMREKLAAKNKKHGLSKSPEYYVWTSMKMRCHNERDAGFKDYGARGILVCDRWLNGENGKSGIECFYEDMGHRPTPHHSIERIDNSGNYEPSNCRWATLVEQQNNRRGNTFLEHNGERLTVSQWERRKGLPKDTIRDRIRKGWSVDDAIERPFDHKRSAWVRSRKTRDNERAA